MQRLLIIGCGDVVSRALPWLTRRYRVYATARTAAHGAELRARGVTPILADLDRPRTLARLAGIGNLVLHSAPPQDSGTRDLRTRRLVAALARGQVPPQRLVYISTSGVYGDCGGAWVGETRPVRPQTARGRRRADAEAVLRRFGVRSGTAVAILRAPGIYAADRLPLARLQRHDPVLAAQEDVFTNHIHAEDLAHIAALALSRGRPGRTYNAADDSRMKMGDYFDLVADAFNLPRPPRVSRAEAGTRLGAAALSFMGESRRLANGRIKRELGIRLKYPTVASGVAAAAHKE
ncbi:MAG: SDR family oxidoreductase [Pseudomonadota bacterium]